MKGGQRIPVVDLYDIVVKKCGKPTYDSCSIMKGPRDVVSPHDLHSNIDLMGTFACSLALFQPDEDNLYFCH